MLTLTSPPKRYYADIGKGMLDVKFARMDPVRATFELPAIGNLQAVGRYLL